MKKTWGRIKRLWKYGENGRENPSGEKEFSGRESMPAEKNRECRYEYRTQVISLSQEDKQELFQGGFVTCATIVAMCAAIMGGCLIYGQVRGYKNLEKSLDSVASYMAAATTDEYDKIARTIRHDLIFSDYNEGIKFLAGHIPNTAEECHMDKEDITAQVYLVCTNTGELYPLDLFLQEETDESDITGNPKKMEMSFAYDEISRTSVYIVKNYEEEQGNATLYRHYGIVSLQRMKTIFCDDCIDKILDVVEGRGISEFMIFDPSEKTFYAIADETVLQIGDYSLTIVCIDNDYKILIK